MTQMGFVARQTCSGGLDEVSSPGGAPADLMISQECSRDWVLGALSATSADKSGVDCQVDLQGKAACGGQLHSKRRPVAVTHACQVDTGREHRSWVAGVFLGLTRHTAT